MEMRQDMGKNLCRRHKLDDRSHSVAPNPILPLTIGEVLKLRAIKSSSLAFDHFKPHGVLDRGGRESIFVVGNALARCYMMISGARPKT